MSAASKLVFATLALVAGVAAFAGEPLACGSAESMDGLMAAWAREYTARHPDTPAQVTRRARYSADLVDALARGEIAVAPFARELFPAERARFRDLAGAEPRLVAVGTGSRATKGGTHAIAIYVNEHNPLARLSLAELREILADDGHLRTWGQLGLTGEWANRAITLHGMRVRRETGNPPGIVNYLEHRVLVGRPWRRDLRDYVDVSAGPQALEQIVRAVAADPAGIGYSGFGYAVPGTRTLALAETDTGPYFAGTAEEIAARTYPLARTIYLATGANPSAPAKAFLEVALSPAGQRALAADPVGFFARPLRPPAGARYVGDDGAVAMVGYNDMAEMVGAWNGRFAQLYPGTRFALRLQGTRTGPPALARGETAVAPMGAEFSPAELADFRARTGGEPAVVRVAHASVDPKALSGPLAVFVPAASSRRSITLAELAEILAGRSSADVRPCTLAPDTALGRFLGERVLAGAKPGANVRVFPQSRDVVRAVAADPRGLGVAAAVAATPEVRALAVAPADGAPAVALTAANVQSGAYPLDRFLLLAVRAPLDPWVRAYLDFALSPEGQALVAGGRLGYLPLNEREVAAERAKLAAMPPTADEPECDLR